MFMIRSLFTKGFNDKENHMLNGIKKNDRLGL